MRTADLFTIFGALLLIAGVALIHIPAALIVAGVLAVLAGERAAARPRRPVEPTPARR